MIRSNIFISYAHEDEDFMRRFDKCLKPITFEGAAVWCDRNEIKGGDDWRTKINEALDSCTAAILLLSPNFFASDFIRNKEYRYLLNAYRDKNRRLQLFIVQLASTIADTTELGNIQWFGKDRPLTELEEGMLDREIEDICRQIARRLGQVVQRPVNQTEEVIQQVRTALANRSDLNIGEFLACGSYAIVCAGDNGSNRVAIKILLNQPLNQYAEDIRTAIRDRMDLENDCFIPVLELFEAQSETTCYQVLIAKLANVPKLETALQQGPLPIDDVVRAIRYAAEALGELHALSSKFNKSGVLTPQNVYYDRHTKHLRFPAFGLSSFLSVRAPWREFFDKYPDSAVYFTPEQMSGEPYTAKSDQYALGQLAFELLEGKFPIKINFPVNAVEKVKFCQQPEKFVSGTWVKRHPELAKIVFRMLRSDPAKRWNSMEEVAQKLRVLESESLCVAKNSYEGKIPDVAFKLRGNTQFFVRFYKNFWKLSPDSHVRFSHIRDEVQAAKLMDAMIDVLTFRPSAEPTSLTTHMDTHRKLGITSAEIEAFIQSFLITLSEPEFAYEYPYIIEAWKTVLGDVSQYIKKSWRARRKAETA